MNQLVAQYSPTFERDLKRLAKKHYDAEKVAEVIDLIIENSEVSMATLKNRHNMHTLNGVWKGCNECHVCNAGDWLLIWKVDGAIALMQRTGTHDELFKN